MKTETTVQANVATTEPKAHVAVKFTKVAAIAKGIRAVATQRRDLTISALFHALVNANISFMADMQREDAALFDNTLRTLLPVKFEKKAGGYVFDKVKAEKVRLDLGIEFQAAEWDAVADKLLAVWLKGNKAENSKELDAQEKRLKAGKGVSRELEKALAAGLSVHEIEVLFIKFKAAHGATLAVDAGNDSKAVRNKAKALEGLF